MHSLFFTEFVGTAILIVLGAGVVANVVLSKTKGNNSGLIVIAFGWAMAVYIGVSVSTSMSGLGHLNPAVTIASALLSTHADINVVIEMIAGQMSGAILGSFIVYAAYKQHFDATENKDLKLGVFATAPAIRNPFWNLVTEIIGTLILVLGGLMLSKEESGATRLGALPVGLLVLAIGLSLGGPTGYAINPARDLGPRIAHFILPIKDKRDSDWSYSWVPVLGPIIGGLLAVLFFKQF